MSGLNGHIPFAPGTPIRLVTDNPRLDGAAAVVVAVTEWGAHVRTAAAASGQYRAHWSEMAPYGSPTGDVCKICGGFQLVRTGSCVTCMGCGTNEGCG